MPLYREFIKGKYKSHSATYTSKGFVKQVIERAQIIPTIEKGMVIKEGWDEFLIKNIPNLLEDRTGDKAQYTAFIPRKKGDAEKHSEGFIKYLNDLPPKTRLEMLRDLFFQADTRKEGTIARKDFLDIVLPKLLETFLGKEKDMKLQPIIECLLEEIRSHWTIKYGELFL